MQAVVLMVKAVVPRISRVSKWRRCRLCCQRLCACCHPDWAELLMFCQKRRSFFVGCGGADTHPAGFTGFCIIKCSLRVKLIKRPSSFCRINIRQVVRPVYEKNATVANIQTLLVSSHSQFFNLKFQISNGMTCIPDCKQFLFGWRNHLLLWHQFYISTFGLPLQVSSLRYL